MPPPSAQPPPPAQPRSYNFPSAQPHRAQGSGPPGGPQPHIHKHRRHQQKLPVMRIIDRAKEAPSLVPVLLSQTEPDKPPHTSETVAVPGLERVALHLWPDSTLKQVGELLYSKCGETISHTLSIALVYTNRRGKLVPRHIGNLQRLHRGPDDVATLAMRGFAPGDLLHVSYAPRGRVRGAQSGGDAAAAAGADEAKPETGVSAPMEAEAEGEAPMEAAAEGDAPMD